MNATQLLAYFDRLAEAPNAVPRLRRFILDLAVRGKLVEQDAGDEPAVELLKRIRSLFGKSLAPKKSDQKADSPDRETDKPFEIPNSWSWSRLFELGRTQTGATPSKNAGEVYGNHMPFVKPGDLLPSYVDYSGKGLSELGLQDSGRFTPAGSLLMVCIGTIGKCQLVDRECSFNQQINSIAPYDGLESRYLLAVFMSEFFQSSAWSASAKTTIAILNKGKWEQLFVPLPPLAEQQRIVAKVDELMALCDHLEATQQERERRRDRLAAASLQLLNQPAADITPAAQCEHARFHLQHLPRLTTRPEHIKAMRQTILNLAVRGLLLSQDATNEPVAALLKEIESEQSQLLRLGAIPKNKTVAAKALLTFAIPALWQVVRLGDVCNLITSGSRGWAEFYAKSGPKFLRAQNIRFGRLRLDDLACVNPPAKSEGARTQVQAGDLLIVITGAGVTNPALLDRDLGEAYVSQHVALVRPSNVALSRWLLLCLMSGPGGRDELVERAYGAGKPGLNLDNIRSLNTPIPPLVEQHRIVAKVDELMALCDQLEAQLTTTQTDSRRLLEAVLEAALAPV